ncbi:hypothetical protein [Brevibacterium luteolum]|uniref:Uncharacterized protein n=1 Tax=Brevibacterium luteolum TaxID=199591 RepID=A0A849AVM2_9MICO|nr:hypothetical protein [Brevibacterium luteolum]MBM7530152.1 hypothetical protein [Brevibacterium luteolum]MCT1920780.1 hypothetical protein [Brevibacterium luteolum]NNG80101.1 hypothetical protein [Brevibacterium luteolum]
MGLLKVWLVMALVLLPNLVNSEMAVSGANHEQTPTPPITVMVDATGGTSFISSVSSSAIWPPPVAVLGEQPDGTGADTARQLAATAVRKRFRFGMGFELATASPQPVMKPTWVIDVTGRDIEATVLADGFDSSYWVMSAVKLSAWGAGATAPVDAVSWNPGAGVVAWCMARKADDESSNSDVKDLRRIPRHIRSRLRRLRLSGLRRVRSR